MNKQKIVLKLFILILFIVIAFISNKVEAKTLYQIQTEYPTGSTWDGNGECLGFTVYVYESYYGVEPYYYNWNALDGYIYDVNQIQPGDIVRYNGHSVWVLEKSGNNFTVAEANYDGHNTVRWYQPKTLSQFSNNFEYLLKAPYVLGTPETTPDAPSNLKVYNQKDDKTLNNREAKITWDKVRGALGYSIDIYKAEDVDKGDFSNVIQNKEYNVMYDLDYTVEIYELDEGEYYAYIYSLRGTTKSNSSRIKFKIKPLTNIEIVGLVDMYKGDTIQLEAVVYPEDTTDYIEYTWYVYDERVISVDENGLVTAIKPGYSDVGVRLTNNLYTKYSRIAHVKTPELEDITLNKNRFILKVGESDRIYATQYPEEAERVHCEFSSLNGDILYCDFNSGIISGESIGETQVEINVRDSNYRPVFKRYVTVIVIDYDLGDVDRNGVVNSTDCTLILRYLKGYEQLDEEQLIIADADENGTVNSTDCTKILRYLKGYEEI